MIIDCSKPDYPLGYRALVNGTEIHDVFYADTDAGFVRQYVYIPLPNGHRRIARPEFDPIPEGENWEKRGRFYTRRLEGNVELIAPGKV